MMKIKMPKKVAVLYSDDDRKYFATDEQHQTAAGAYEDAYMFEPYLKKLDIKSCYIKADSQLAMKLEKEKPDMVINLVTVVKGYDYLAASIPGLLELMNIPYTGTNILGFSLGSNKFVLHALLEQNGVPVPNYQLFSDISTPLDKKLRYPLILKLNEEHSNVEITLNSIVENEKELRKRLKYLKNSYNQDILVSEFIEGREFAAFLIEDLPEKVYVNERIINLPGADPRFQFMDYELVWNTHGEVYDDRLKHKTYKDLKLTKFVEKAFKICRMDGYGKFDVRMDKKGNYYFIDANANCYFAPFDPITDSEITRTVGMYGISFEKLLTSIFTSAFNRKL